MTNQESALRKLMTVQMESDWNRLERRMRRLSWARSRPQWSRASRSNCPRSLRLRWTRLSQDL
eukprot:9501918-Prorocentrum_lima.AAC.1